MRRGSFALLPSLPHSVILLLVLYAQHILAAGRRFRGRNQILSLERVF